MSKTFVTVVAFIAAVLFQGCAFTKHNAYTNTLADESKDLASKASFEIAPRNTKKQPRVLVVLALSGGGSRAAYFSARTMFALQSIPGPDQNPINALNEVDLISSVSGGSIAAAYYASTYDPGQAAPTIGRRTWDEASVSDLMRQNYISRWLLNWFWPENIFKFWFTAFDRTDIMAQTFADNFFDSTVTGFDLHMHDLNPDRPNLVLNATVGSRSYDEENGVRAKRFGNLFTFTREDFSTKLNSNIASYEIARAVMSSATFPAAFNYMTLRDFHEPPVCPGNKGACYVHVFDGGNSDNLGLLSVKRALLSHNAAYLDGPKSYDRVIVIFVDAYRRSRGVNPAFPNPRRFLDYIVDTNFMDATDSLLEANRARILEEFFARNIANYEKTEHCYRDNLPDHACVASNTWRDLHREQLLKLLKKKLFFFHVTFDAVTDVNVREKLHTIPTTFKFAEGEMQAIEKGVADIFSNPANITHECVRRIGEIIARPTETEAIVPGNIWCGGSESAETASRKQMMQK
jgi:predicted acylesterase/phospholipase RssA